MHRPSVPILIVLLFAAAASVSCADTLRVKEKGDPRAEAHQVELEAPRGKDTLMLTQGGSNVGYTVYRFPTKDQDGRPVTTSLAVWYPTTAPEADFTYFYGTESTRTRLAKDAPASAGRFPLVVYSHGAAAGGLASAYVTETLARRGYVVAAIDHTDEAYFSRITDNGSSRAPRGGLVYATKVYFQLKSPKSKDRRGDMMFRPLQLKDAIAFLVEQDRKKGSLLNGRIETDSIGLIGHSFGAWTVLMEAGVDSRFSDGRIRAVASLSSPANENIFQPGELAKIKVPVMFMYGEKEVSLGRSGDKQYFFDRANAPKYMLEVAGADHLSFGRDKKMATLSDHLTKDPGRACIARYLLAFMDLYLKSDAAAKEQLMRKGEGVRSYVYEAAELPKLK